MNRGVRKETGIEGQKRVRPNERAIGFIQGPDKAETLFHIPERYGAM